MTIVAGFCVKEGVLICADTEHTGSGFNVYESKIIFSPLMDVGRVVFSYSGHSFLAKAAIQKCIEALHSTNRASAEIPSAIARKVEETIDNEYRRHVSSNPDSSADSAYQIMFGVWSPGKRPELFTTWQGTAARCENYDFIGIGGYVGRLLVDPIFHSGIPASEAHSMASYAIVKAKEAASGVGGPTNAVLLSNDGNVQELPWHEHASEENIFAMFNYAVQGLLVSMISAPDVEFTRACTSFKVMLDHIRLMGNFSDEGRNNPEPKFFMGSNLPTRRAVLRPTKYDPSGQPPSQE